MCNEYVQTRVKQKIELECAALTSESVVNTKETNASELKLTRVIHRCIHPFIFLFGHLGRY